MVIGNAGKNGVASFLTRFAHKYKFTGNFSLTRFAHKYKFTGNFSLTRFAHKKEAVLWLLGMQEKVE